MAYSNCDHNALQTAAKITVRNLFVTTLIFKREGSSYCFPYKNQDGVTEILGFYFSSDMKDIVVGMSSIHYKNWNNTFI